MPTYDLGTLTIAGHDVDQLTEALDIPEHRFEPLVELAHKAWEYEDTISESIEFIAKNTSGSELVLTLVFFGRIWEKNNDEPEEDQEDEGESQE